MSVYVSEGLFHCCYFLHQASHHSKESEVCRTICYIIVHDLLKPQDGESRNDEERFSLKKIKKTPDCLLEWKEKGGGGGGNTKCTMMTETEVSFFSLSQQNKISQLSRPN